MRMESVVSEAGMLSGPRENVTGAWGSARQSSAPRIRVCQTLDGLNSAFGCTMLVKVASQSPNQRLLAFCTDPTAVSEGSPSACATNPPKPSCVPLAATAIIFFVWLPVATSILPNSEGHLLQPEPLLLRAE